MQRLQTWLRISMASQRLSAVAFMGIHRNHGLNYTEMVKKFFLHPRKVQIWFSLRKFRNLLIHTSE